jgi:hypothetical protein
MSLTGEGDLGGWVLEVLDSFAVAASFKNFNRSEMASFRGEEGVVTLFSRSASGAFSGFFSSFLTSLTTVTKVFSCG